MTTQVPDDANQLLERWRTGDDDARAKLLDLLHVEMRRIAAGLMRRERRGHTLQPTAVVNEACLRLLRVGEGPASTRGEFLGLAAHVMRQVLVDHARRKAADRRGGEWQRVSIELLDPGSDPSPGLVDAIDLDAALERLARLSPRQARVAELRYFGGLSIPEAAEVLGVGLSTVKDEWAVARLWLQHELGGRGAAGPTT